MAGFGVKMGSAVCLIGIFSAYFYHRQAGNELEQHMNYVLSGLLRAEKKVSVVESHEPKVAVAFGSCLDIRASGLDVLQGAQIFPPESPDHLEEIANADDLAKMFAYFFQHGAAAERFTSNQSLFDDLNKVAKSLSDSFMEIGGNAPVMAARFQKEGCKVLLGAKMSESLRKELPQEIQVTGQGEADDIHLILEYEKGSHWGQYTSSRANRFILHSDDYNPHISTLDDFTYQVRQFSPTLMVVGGLQMLDKFPFQPGERQQRLQKVRDLLVSTDRKTRIHFEMASFAEEECLRDVIDNVVYYSDSLGMNEQELPNLHSLLNNRSVTLISDPYPRIATTLDQMRAVYKTLQEVPESGGRRRLTRLHVHTLAYQAIMTTKGSSWKNTMSAAAKASLVANRHTCGSNYIYTEKAKILMDDSFKTSLTNDGRRIPFQPDRPVSCWDEDNVLICIAPVLVCTEVVQTAGGGDNISSAGLVLQI